MGAVSDEGAGAGVLGSGAGSDAGMGSAATGLSGLKLTAAELTGARLSATESLDFEAAVCCAFDAPVTGAGLLPASPWISMTKKGDGSVWMGVGVGVGVGACSDAAVVVDIDVGGGVAAEGVGAKMPGAGFEGRTGFELTVDQDAGGSDELLGIDDAAAFAADVPAVDAGAARDNAGTSGGWIVGGRAVGACVVGTWSSAARDVSIEIAAWTGLSVVGGAGEAAGPGLTAAAGVGEPDVSETGVDETTTVGGGEAGAHGAEDCAGAVKSCAGTLNNERAPSDAAWAMADGSSGEFVLASLGTGEFAGELAALELPEKMSRAELKFDAGSAAAGAVTVDETAEVAVETSAKAG